MAKATKRKSAKHAAAVVFGPTFGLTAGAYVVPAKRSWKGPRQKFYRSEYAVAAIGALYPAGVPDSVGNSKLWEQVERRLSRDKIYCARYARDKDGHLISRQTVMRARDDFHAANNIPPRKERRAPKAPRKPTSVVTGPLARGALRRQPLTAAEIKAIADRAEGK
jgi:hypothetical protein